MDDRSRAGRLRRPDGEDAGLPDAAQEEAVGTQRASDELDALARQLHTLVGQFTV